MSEKTTAHPVRKWLVALRTEHWIKSGFCLTALFFHGSVLEPAAWMAVLPIALCFCLISSAVYLANDIVNRAEDRRHPRKCRRPIASGQISVRRAWLAIVLLAGGSLGFAWWFYGGGTVTGVLAGYYLLSWIYSYYLRGLPLLDVLVLATGFVARVAAGAYALQRFDLTAHPTGWLLSCTYFLALLLGWHLVASIGGGDMPVVVSKGVTWRVLERPGVQSRSPRLGRRTVLPRLHPRDLPWSNLRSKDI